MKKVLLCDDSMLVRRQLRDYISQQRKDVTVIEAVNGIEAVEKYAIERPDLVLMDIVMPEMDGIGCLKSIRKLDPQAKIIVLSSVGNRETLLEALEAGALDFIQKPWTEKVINRILDLY
ncbi:response regulator [Anoxynatronum buryatiense]|uniref:Stage 0 sporulation protein A homolog n=1 Tax=Anoxynatronum buryatiense TaxID=489973 RepID=A0AA45WWU1_9CLOT|nr:response regulator [Anoxynatronum buryatiense]SMP61450.1 two-component system, chemotaxis family, response regulator CheY [Anoxynatronum buryatiense]